VFNGKVGHRQRKTFSDGAFALSAKRLVKLDPKVNLTSILRAVFCTKIISTAFLKIQFGSYNINNISPKAAPKMLVKFTTGRHDMALI